MALIVQNLAGQFSSAKAGIGCAGRLLRGSEEREQKYRSHTTRLLCIRAVTSLSFGTQEIAFVLNLRRGRFWLILKACFSSTEAEERVGSYLRGPVILLTLGFSFLPLSFYFRSRITKILSSVRAAKFLFSPVVRRGFSKWPMAHGLWRLFVPIAKNESHHCNEILSVKWPRTVSGSAHMWGVNHSCMRSHSSLPLRK